MDYLRILKARTRRYAVTETIIPEYQDQDATETQPVLAETNNISDEEITDKYFQCLWPCLRMFRILGLCPISKYGNFLKPPTRICSMNWLPTAVLSSLALSLVCNYFVDVYYSFSDFKGRISVPMVIHWATSLVYYAQIVGNLLFAIFQTSRIPKFFSCFQEVENNCRSYRTGVVSKLQRNCFVLLVLFGTLQIAEVLMFYISLAYRQIRLKNIEYFFYSLTNGYMQDDWGNCCGGFLLLAQIVCRSTCSFGEVLLCIFSLVLTHYFEEINAVFASGAPASASLEKVEELRGDHVKICELVEMCNDIFGPLFLLTYTSNILHIFTGLDSAIRYGFWSDFYLERVENTFRLAYQVIFKLLLPSYLGGRLHQTAHEGLNHIANWVASPATEHSTYLLIGLFIEHFRFPIALHGCKHFYITQGFIGELVGALIIAVVIIIHFTSLKL